MQRWFRNFLRRPSTTTAAAPVPETPAGDQIDAWMREAYALHQAGDVANAEDRYRWILREQPGNVDALFLLGELANRSGRHERAIELVGKAIAAQGDLAIFHREIAAAYRGKGDFASAERSLARVLELDPGELQARIDLGLAQLDQRKAAEAERTFRDLVEDRPDLLVTHVNLGAALSAQRRFEEAGECFREALKVDPFCAQALSNLGSIHIKLGELEEGKKLVQRALEIDPLSFEAKINLSTVLLKEKQWGAALRILEDSVRTQPGRAEVHANIGKLHNFLGDTAAAIAALSDALRLNPGLVDAQLELGKAYFDSGRLDEALEQLRKAVQTDPSLPMGHLDLGHALDCKGETAQALACYDKALELEPGYVQARLNRAAVLLRQGDFARGWPEYEWRLQTKVLRRYYERFAIPRWDGSPLAGRTLLVYSEQGIGDEIMYASCFPELIAQDGHCVIECAGKLAALFRRCFPQATVLAESKDDPAGWLEKAPPIDVAIPAASLPLYLRRSAADFPRERAYLGADPARVARWRARLDALGPGMKVGLSWRGGVAETGTALRSIALERLLPVLKQEGACCVSLQYGDCRADLARLQRLHGIELPHWQEAIDDYEETAALVSALDLTLSVCTAVVHLGGAQGRPVWVMAPRRPEARYGEQGESMPWYASVRMFRQPAFGDWDSVIARVSAALAQLARNPAC